MLHRVTLVVLAAALPLAASTAPSHSEPALSLHFGPLSYPGCTALSADTLSCGTLDVEGNPASVQRAYVLISDVTELRGVQFGVTYPATVNVLYWQDCGGALSIGDSWPASGGGIAMTWVDAIPGRGLDDMAILGFFEIGVDSHGVMEVTADPRTDDAAYVDADLSTHVISSEQLGRADTGGEGGGMAHCGAPEWPGGLGLPGGSAGGSGGPLELGGASFVVAKFAKGIVHLPPEADCGSVDGASISSADVDSILRYHEVTELVKAAPSFNPATDRTAVSRTGEIVLLSDYSETYYLIQPDTLDATDLADDLRALSVTVFAAGEILGTPTDSVEPTDEYFQDGTQWHLHNYGQTSPIDGAGTAGADIAATQAWLISTGSPAGIIAIFDGGFDDTHEDLSGKVIPPPISDVGHGTGQWEWHGRSSAGCAAANTNDPDGTGTAGVDWNAQLISKRVDNVGGDVGIALGLIHAIVVGGARVTNHSYIWGDSPDLRMGFRDAYMLNAVNVAGTNNYANEGNPVTAPGKYPETIAVGKTDRRDRWVPNSAYWPEINLAAPGQNIPVPWGPSADSYTITSGVSLASPYVAGIASVMLALNPDLYNDDIRRMLEISADDIKTAPATSGFDIYTGYGRVNMRQALARVVSPNFQTLHETAFGETTVYQVSDPFNLTIHGMATADECGLQSENETWLVTRLEVRRDVAFTTAGFHSDSTVSVWARGAATIGWNDEAPNFRLGWCEPVPGTVTNSGCTFRTFVYAVLDETGNACEYVPTDPGSVVFAYTLHGYTTVVATPEQLFEGSSGTDLRLVSSHPTSIGATIRFRIPNMGHVVLSLFDVSGREVRRLLDELIYPGVFEMPWDGRSQRGVRVASGVYFLRMRTPTTEVTRKVVVAR